MPIDPLAQGSGDAADWIHACLERSPAVLFRARCHPERGEFIAHWLSANAERLLGAADDLARPGGWIERVHPADRDRVRVAFEYLPLRRSLIAEYRMLGADGRYVWVRDERHLVALDEDDTLLVEGSWLDVSDRRQAQDRLHAREQLLRQLVETGSDAVCLVHTDGRVAEVNRAGLGLLETEDAAAIIDRPLFQRIAPGHRARAAVLARRVMAGEPVVMQLDMLSVKGRRRRIEARAAPLFDALGAVSSAVIVARDISGPAAAESRARFLAHYDPLTGLPNRGLFRDRLLQAMAQARRSDTLLSVMFLDMDNFKDVNDTLGHAVGDQMLKGIAARITACTRASDTVARFGGDEFGVIQTGITTVGDAADLAERILQRINAPMVIEGHELHPSMSIGLIIYPYEDHDADELLRSADLAMYKAKREGRNRYQFYAADLNRVVQRRAVIERELRTALSRDQFRLCYQPQVSLQDGRVVGVEALLRWHHPERGEIGPEEFIPVAESAGLIMPIGEWVMAEACRQIAAWGQAGLPPLRVAINLSAAQFRHKNLLNDITAVLEEHAVDPALLEIELTESLIMHDVRNTIATLEHLRRLGVQISIDDFGTGYSSLSYLTRFPVHKIKLDKSFVAELHKADGAAIARTVVGLGHTLGLRVMAEGVEGPEQVAFLHEQGCHEAQGYYFSRPMPPGALQRLLAEGAEALRERALPVWREGDS
ncbi:putative bifunctional diguanylate cyclase/phosphodiesterase [Thiohalobacter sp.]|uniref:putative bifunctional diguanylate cyclase/phosphodiesterase n=1 Tax=Thiohalobacter sp. TaxID=2025948 RepID=UPI002639D505|nr:GGDEF and EAL domain-containing protein [Thiohalobacter sp.]